MNFEYTAIPVFDYTMFEMLRDCFRWDSFQCCTSKHAWYDCVQHQLLDVVLIEDWQVVVVAAVNE